MPLDSAIPFQGIYPKEKMMVFHKALVPKMFMTVQSIIEAIKEIKCP